MNGWMTAWPVHLLRPWWLLGLLVLPLLAWALRRAQAENTALRDAIDPHLRPHLLVSTATPSQSRRFWWAATAWSVAMIALAGPSLGKEEQRLWQTRAPLVVALDLSEAMLATDVQPSRLLQARAKIALLLQARAGGQVALVAFADDAYTVAPLTDDAANIALFLDALHPNVMPAPGHRLDRAIDWSAGLLRQSGFDAGDILLISAADGDATAAARRAQAAGYRVSTLAVGRTAVTSNLRSVAATGGGRSATLTPGIGDLQALRLLDPAQTGATAGQGRQVALWTDHGYWLLSPLLLLLLWGFRRNGVFAAMLLMCMLLPTAPVQAQATNWWWRVDQQAHRAQQRGIDAYRQRDYAKAATAFAQVPTADGQYNLGNALAKQGRYDEAIAAYDRALALQPGMADAVANREAVRRAQRRQPPSGGQRQQQNQQQGQRQNQPQTPQQGRQPQGQRPPDSPSPGQPNPQNGQGNPQPQSPSSPPHTSPPRFSSPSPQPSTTPEQQRAADAEQRRRMQQALRDKPAGSAPSAATRPTQESPEQRARRLANDAELRRVPDDPGALLRARFRLEHERRNGGGR